MSVGRHLDKNDRLRSDARLAVVVLTCSHSKTQYRIKVCEYISDLMDVLCNLQ